MSQDRSRVVKCCEFTKDTVGKTVHMFDMLNLCSMMDD